MLAQIQADSGFVDLVVEKEQGDPELEKQLTILQEVLPEKNETELKNIRKEVLKLL